MPRQDFAQRQEAKRERLERAADRARAKANDAYKRADMSEEATGIPFGQPILVGHHSEGRHRAALKRADNAMRKSIDEDRKAGEYAARAASVGTGGISSDDPEAVTKLTAKLERLETKQTMMRQANKVIRAFHKAGVRDAESGAEWDRYLQKLTEAGFTGDVGAAAQLLQPDFAGRIGFADYQLTNNSAEIRRLRKRIESMRSAETVTTSTINTNAGVTIIENAEENRVQLVFPGKPGAEIRAILKRHGFRWSPTAGAWQRMLNNAGIYAARQIVKSLTDRE